MDLLKFSFISFLLVALTGCAVVTTPMYKGVELPPSELSIINQFYSLRLTDSGNENVMGSQLVLISVDGVQLSDIDIKGFGGVEVLPGEHTFEYAVNSVAWLPFGTVHRFEDTYMLTVTTPKGKKGAPILKNPDLSSSSEMCMFFTDIDKPYVFLELSQLPPNTPYEFQCNTKVLDFSDEKKWGKVGIPKY